MKIVVLVTARRRELRRPWCVATLGARRQHVRTWPDDRGTDVWAGGGGPAGPAVDPRAECPFR